MTSSERSSWVDSLSANGYNCFNIKKSCVNDDCCEVEFKTGETIPSRADAYTWVESQPGLSEAPSEGPSGHFDGPLVSQSPFPVPPFPVPIPSPSFVRCGAASLANDVPPSAGAQMPVESRPGLSDSVDGRGPGHLPPRNGGVHGGPQDGVATGVTVSPRRERLPLLAIQQSLAAAEGGSPESASSRQEDEEMERAIEESRQEVHSAKAERVADHVESHGYHDGIPALYLQRYGNPPFSMKVLGSGAHESHGNQLSQQQESAKQQQQLEQQEGQNEQTKDDEAPEVQQEALRALKPADKEEKRARLPPECAPGETGRVEVLLRLPDGKRLRRAFRASNAVGALYDLVDVECDEDGPLASGATYRLVSAMPKKAYEDRTLTLEEAGIQNQWMLHVESLQEDPHLKEDCQQNFLKELPRSSHMWWTPKRASFQE